MSDYYTDQNFGYGQYRDQMSDYYNNRDFGYGQYRDQVDDYRDDRNFTYGQYIDVKGRRVFDDVKLNTPDYVLEDFNTENLVDYYDGHLDEFWWWHEIQKEVQNQLNKNAE